MKDYIREENCKFIVNKDARKVVCIFEGGDNIEDYLESKVSGTYLYWDVNLNLANRYVGIATCAENDEWDEKIGRRIAFYKMKKKFYNALFRRVNKVIDACDNELARIADSFNLLGAKVQRFVDHETKYIEGLK